MGDISRLPEDIIHHILYYFDTKEATRTSILCKAWYNAWFTCPTLKLDLSLNISDSCIVSHVNQLIEIASENGVKRIDLDFSIEYSQLIYTLPRMIFEAKSLRELKIKGLGMALNKRVEDKVMFDRLQTLNLTFINIDDDTFEGIIAGCPLIESIYICLCKSLKRIKVAELYNLEELTVYAYLDHGVDIEASNLRYLDCSLEGGSLKLYNTETLKSLSLRGSLPSVTYLDNFGHKFPQVKDLTLTSLRGQRRINISSHSLENIVLSSTQDLWEVNIDAPNMVSLELKSVTSFPYLSLTNSPSRWEFKIDISHLSRLNADHFCKMKQFLAKVILSKISLVLSWSRQKYDLVEIQKIPICPVVEVEDVRLDLSFSTPSPHSNLLDALFLTCHPKVIIVHGYRHAPDFLFKNLIERRNEECRRHETKFWYQELKEVRLEIYDETNHQWLPSDLKSLPEGPQNRLKVYFRLEWESTS